MSKQAFANANKVIIWQKEVVALVARSSLIVLIVKIPQLKLKILLLIRPCNLTADIWDAPSVKIKKLSSSTISTQGVTKKACPSAFHVTA